METTTQVIPDLLIRYEQLRSQIVNTSEIMSSPGLGLDLFINRGMHSWINAWPSSISVPTITKSSDTLTIPRIVNKELIHIIANMISGSQQLKAFNV